MPRQTAFFPEKQEKLSALPKMRKPFCAFLLSRPVWGAWIEILIRSPGLHPGYGPAPHGAQARSRPSTEPVDGRLCIHAFFSSAPRRSSGRTPGCRHRSSGCGENPAPGGDIHRNGKIQVNLSLKTTFFQTSYIPCDFNVSVRYGNDFDKSVNNGLLIFKGCFVPFLNMVGYNAQRAVVWLISK